MLGRVETVCERMKIAGGMEDYMKHMKMSSDISSRWVSDINRNSLIARYCSAEGSGGCSHYPTLVNALRCDRGVGLQERD